MNGLQRWIGKNLLGFDIKQIDKKAEFTNVSDNAYVNAFFQFLYNTSATTNEYTDDFAIRYGYAYNPDVYAIVNYMATSFSALDFKLMSDEDEIDQHPLIDLLYNPNPRNGKGLFLETLLIYKLTTGNSYIYGPSPDTGDNRGKPQELWVLPSQKVRIETGGVRMPIKGYVLEAPTQQRVGADEVLHWRYANPDYESGKELYGLSPLEAANRLVQKSNDALTTETALFENGGPAQIIARDKGTMGEDFTQEMASALEKSNRLKYEGSHNKGKIAYTGGVLKVHQVGSTPVDLQLNESQMYSFRQLCRIFKFPPQLLGDNASSTYNNVQEAKKSLYTDALIPEFKSLCDELNRWIVKRYDERMYLTCDTSNIEVLQQDNKEMVEWLKEAWWISGTDKQRLMGLEQDEELRDYYAMGIVGKVIKDAPEQSMEELEKMLKDNGINDYV